MWHSGFISAKWCTIMFDFLPRYPANIIPSFAMYIYRKIVQKELAKMISWMMLCSFFASHIFYYFIRHQEFFCILHIPVCFLVQALEVMQNACNFHDLPLCIPKLVCTQIKWSLCFYFWILLYWKNSCGSFHGLGHFESHRPKHSKQSYNVYNDMSTYFSPMMNSLENTSSSVSIQDNPMKSIALISCTVDGGGFWIPPPTEDDTSVFWL